VADWDIAATSTALAANVPRYLASRLPLDTDEQATSPVRRDGAHTGDNALANGRGLVLVGSHLGAHVAAARLYRHGVPSAPGQRPRTFRGHASSV